jgi:hypothetical protein
MHRAGATATEIAEAMDNVPTLQHTHKLAAMNLWMLAVGAGLIIFGLA